MDDETLFSLRKKCFSEMPWVGELYYPVPCEAIKYDRGKNNTVCKNNAKWHFIPSTEITETGETSTAKEGNYCWNHLIYSGLFNNMIEESRTAHFIQEWLHKENINAKSLE